MPGLYQLVVIPDTLEYIGTMANFRIKVLRPLGKDDFSQDMVKLMSD